MKLAVASLLIVLCVVGCGSSTDNAEAIRRGDAHLKEGRVREALIEFQRAVQANERDGVPGTVLD